MLIFLKKKCDILINCLNKITKDNRLLDHQSLLYMILYCILGLPEYNDLMENFFGLLKTEMFYDQENNYKTIDELILAIDDYINYYNYDRIKVKLKELSPVKYRLQSSN